MTLTVTISGNPVNALHKSVKPHDTVDLRKTLTFVVRDDSSTANYQPGEPVTLFDDVSGYTFKGFVNDAQVSNSYPNTLNYITVTCSDNHALADWVYSKKDYENQYSGDIVSDLLSNYLAAEGVTAHYAIRRDTTQAQFSQGVLSGTVATNNVVDGDLELAPAGSDLSIVESSTADFSTGGLTNTIAINNTLTGAPIHSIKLIGTMTTPGITTPVASFKVWQGSYVVQANDHFRYYLWVDPASPEIKAGINLYFSDGTNLWDTATTVNYDGNFFSPNGATDLAGYADGNWYNRSVTIGNSYSGKTISYISVNLCGTKAGMYTAYFNQIITFDGISTATTNTFYDNSTPISANQAVRAAGYADTSIAEVNTYFLPTYHSDPSFGNPLNSLADRRAIPYSRKSAGTVVTPVKLLKHGFISWNSTDTAHTKTAIYAYFANTSRVECVNNSFAPGLIPGMKVNPNVFFLEERFYRLAGASPEECPVLNSVEVTLESAANASLVDHSNLANFVTSPTDMTYTNVQPNTKAGIISTGLQLAGTTYDFAYSTVNGFGAGTFFSSGTANWGITQRCLSMFTGATGVEAKHQFTNAGTFADFILEIDVQLNTDNLVGIHYRSTNLSNNAGSYAYGVFASNAGVVMKRGTNTTGGGSTTTLHTTSMTLADQSWHRIKLVVSGSSHSVSLDDVFLFTQSDSTFASAGYTGVYLQSPTAATNTTANANVLYNNFGIVAALTGTSVQTDNQTLTSLGTYGDSYIIWRDISESPGGLNIVLVEVSVDNGSTWGACTNNAALPGNILSPGMSLSGITLKFRYTLTTTTATKMPGLDMVSFYIRGGYSSSGTRISPALPLTPVAGAAGSTLVSWDAILSPGTALFIDTTLDNGLTFTNVGSGASGSAPIPGIITQPDPIIDEFDTGSTRYVPRIFGGTLILTVANPNYTTYSLGVGVAAITYDTAHSRITAIGASGNNTLFRSDLVIASDMSIQADVDEANNSGLAVRITSTNSCYLASLSDSAAGNTFTLYSVVNGTVFTQIATGTLDFTRGTPHRFILSAIDTTITLSMDGATLTSVTNNTVTGTGKAGLLLNQLLRCYGLRIQGLGASVVGTSVSTRSRLISIDPGATPQLTDLTVSVHNPNIANGTRIPLAQYSILSGSSNTLAQDFDDLAKQSNYVWDIDTNLDFFFAPRHAKPAPWILSDPDVLVANCQLHTINDLYRNDQFGTGGKDIIPFTKSFVGDGSTTNWTMDYPVDALTGVTINNVGATVGVKGVDTGRDFYYEQGSLVIIQSATALPRVNTQTLVFAYNAQVNTVVEMRSDTQITLRAAIDKTNGIIEATEDMTGLSKTAMIQLAQSRLNQYAVVGQTLTCTTMRSGLAAGMLQPVFLSRFGIMDGQFLITDVSPTWSISRGTLQPYYALTMTSGPVIGDYTRFLSNIARGGL